jgi:membrane-associated phospholipid phosphatase
MDEARSERLADWQGPGRYAQGDGHGSIWSSFSAQRDKRGREVPALPSARGANRLLVAYLAATLLPALLAARGGVAGARAVLAAHVMAFVLFVFAIGRRRREVTQLEQWMMALGPLVAIPFLYAELPTLMAGLSDGYRDAVVQPWERAVFGGMPARTLAPAVRHTVGSGVGTVVSELLYASYLSYYVLIYLPPLLLLAQRRYVLYARTLAGMMTAFLTCFFVFVIFPVEGPRYIWASPDVGMEGPIRALTHRLVEVGSSRGAEFPSSHVAVAVAQSVMAVKWQPRIGVAAAVATVLLSIAVVFAGYHYAVDVVAGSVIGAAIGMVATAGRLRHL